MRNILKIVAVLALTTAPAFAQDTMQHAATPMAQNSSPHGMMSQAGGSMTHHGAMGNDARITGNMAHGMNSQNAMSHDNMAKSSH